MIAFYCISKLQFFKIKEKNGGEIKLGNIEGIIKITDISNSAWLRLFYKKCLILFICALRPAKLPLIPQRWVFTLAPFIPLPCQNLTLNLPPKAS